MLILQNFLLFSGVLSTKSFSSAGDAGSSLFLARMISVCFQPNLSSLLVSMLPTDIPATAWSASGERLRW